jgi:hypothetical protein
MVGARRSSAIAPGPPHLFGINESLKYRFGVLLG